MWKKKFRIFSRSHKLEGEIEEFMQKLAESALIFKMAVITYLRDGASPDFEDKLQQINQFESQNDKLRRSVEKQLYQETLIPESRGDVLGLLENLDQIMGCFEGACFAFSIEQPEIQEEFHTGYTDLVNASVECVEYLVTASRAFFKQPETVSDHIHKVMFYEKEADKISSILKRKIYESDLDLAQKSHLKSFVEYIDNVADKSEDVADRLGIYAIKRAI